MSKPVTYATLPIDKVSFDPENARLHPDKNIEAIKGSLQKFGQQKPIVITRSGIVVAGNGTLAAAKALGMQKINVKYTDLQGDDIDAYALADNRTSDLAEWDKGILGTKLQRLYEDGFDIASIGFDHETFIPEFKPAGIDDQGNLGEKKLKTCPECGHEF